MVRAPRDFVIQIKSALNREIPGLLHAVDALFYINFRKTFVDYFFENPADAYKRLRELYEDTGTDINLVMIILLKHIFGGDTITARIALEYLEKGEEGKFLELFRRYVH